MKYYLLLIVLIFTGCSTALQIPDVSPEIVNMTYKQIPQKDGYGTICVFKDTKRWFDRYGYPRVLINENQIGTLSVDNAVCAMLLPKTYSVSVFERHYTYQDSITVSLETGNIMYLVVNIPVLSFIKEDKALKILSTKEIEVVEK